DEGRAAPHASRGGRALRARAGPRGAATGVVVRGPVRRYSRGYGPARSTRGRPGPGGADIFIRNRMEDIMASTIGRRSAVAGVLMATFAAGYLCGSLGQPRGDAQMKDLGGTLLQGAAGAGGALGSIGGLGTSIVEMQDHVTGLQKNLDTLKKVQASLTGK